MRISKVAEGLGEIKIMAHHSNVVRKLCSEHTQILVHASLTPNVIMWEEEVTGHLDAFYI